MRCRGPLTLFLWVADLRWYILDFQGPFAFSLFSPAVDGHELPVREPLIGKIQQSAIGNAGLESEGPAWGARPGVGWGTSRRTLTYPPGGTGRFSPSAMRPPRSSGRLVGKCPWPQGCLAVCFPNPYSGVPPPSVHRKLEASAGS